MRRVVVVLVVVAVLVSGFAVAVSGTVAAQSAVTQQTIAIRDQLVFDQEALLNVYRCRFGVDTQVVPGGCAGGQPSRFPAGPGVFEGHPAPGDIEIRDRLIGDQEALLNVYRCRFGVDTQVVPGGCAQPGPRDSSSVGPDAGVVPIQAVYLVPQGKSPVVFRAEAIAAGVVEAQRWFRSQTEGRHPLFARDRNSVSVKTIELDRPLSRFAGTTDLADHVREALRLPARTPLLIVMEASFYPDGASDFLCARHSGSVIVFPLANCSFSPEPGDRWPNRFSSVIAHELVHLLGAAWRQRKCAPNYLPIGHVDDDANDVIYAGPGGRNWVNPVLDSGNDDYYLHGRTDCYDIDRNPLLVSEPGVTLTPLTPTPTGIPFQAVYAVPSDVASVAGRESSIASVIGEVQKWYRSQTGGRHPLFARDGPSVSVVTVHLDQPRDAVRDFGRKFHSEIRRMSGLNPQAPLLVIIENPTSGCGHRSYVVGVTTDCVGAQGEDAVWWISVARHLAKALRADIGCGPNSTGVLGYNDDNRDLFYDGPENWDRENLVLDAGNDDYYMHDNDDCYDIADNPLLAPG
ncbi:MAG: hypothetical protein OXG30_04575 [bacterium]|nr:hypothetical protein [bacterium]